MHTFGPRVPGCHGKLAFLPAFCHGHGRMISAMRSGVDSSNAALAKTELLQAIVYFASIQARDGKEAVDFGVKGGELDKKTRAPRNLADGEGFYRISEDLGRAADVVFGLVDRMAGMDSLAIVATRGLGTPSGPTECPLHGEWRLLFTTAADASFSKNSSRGDARASNILDAAAGTVTNVINFVPADTEGGRPPALEQLRVNIATTALSGSKVGLQFKYVKARVTRLFGVPLFGHRLTLTFPVPGPFLTRILFFFTRKRPPQAYFEVLYLDETLRIHRTGQGNLFIQQRIGMPSVL